MACREEEFFGFVSSLKSYMFELYDSYILNSIHLTFIAFKLIERHHIMNAGSRTKGPRLNTVQMWLPGSGAWKHYVELVSCPPADINGSWGSE